MTVTREAETQADGTALSTRQKLSRGAVVLAVLALVAMWVYAFGFASKDAVAFVSDTAWSKRAALICERSNDLLAANAEQARETSDGGPQALGAAVAQATTIIELTLNEVVAEQPAAATDRALVDEFERLYRIYLNDRKLVTAKLLAGEQVELNETLQNGAPVSKIIADFTSVNRMDSCQVPPQF